jgi:hypothetical protein
VSAMPRHGLGHPPVACGVGRVAWVADCGTINPLGRVQVASKATIGHSAWERTSSAGQGAERRYTALTDRLQQG